MKSAAFFALFSAFLIGAQATAPIKSLVKTAVVPNRFIIEVDDTSTPGTKRSFDHPLNAVYRGLESRGVKVTVTKEFRADGIFNGAALVVRNVEDVDLIKNTPGIKAVRPIKIFPRPHLPKRYVPTGPQDPKILPDTLSTHILGGVDKVHAEGNIGTGVKIGIIDTGIDYNHPFLGSNGFGPGKKIFAGYDFVGDNFNPADPKPVPDSDPLDCEGHGTHVAGVISAIPGNPYNISGVAYGASIGAYKVFGCDGGTSDDILVDSLLRGVKDGMDILTMSIGGPDGWSSSSAAVVADRISRQGKIVTIAAGNEGSSGSWYAASPASGAGVIAVGSIDNTVIAVQNATISGVDHPPITYFSALPFKIDGSLPVFATSNDTTIVDDACSRLSEDTPDLSKFLVVIRRGTCPFANKLADVQRKGAKAVFIYDNGTGFAPISTGNFTMAALIRAADGEFLVQQFAAGAKITVSFPQTGGATDLPDPHGGLMSDFSTYGPTFDFKFKPSLSAPGGSIMSTFPIANGSYAVLSGTSMATPYVAGGAALLLAAKGKGAAKDSRTLFETTSNMIPATKEDRSSFDTASKAGAGLINVYKAIHSKTTVSPGQLVLNDTTHFQGKHVVDVWNHDSTPKQYTLKHVPALTALTMKEKSILPSIGPVPLVSAPATVDIVPSTFTVQPGACQKVAVSITPPTGADASRFPLYSGFVEVTSGSESHHVTYLGLAASLKDHQVLDNTTAILPIQAPALLTQDGMKFNETKSFAFNGTDYPTLLYRLAMGTPSLLVDLVDPETKLKTPLDKRQLVVPGITFTPTKTGSSNSNVKIIGNLFSRAFVTRNDENMGMSDPSSITAYYTLDFLKPQFANGAKIPNGQYRIMLRALRITGNPALDEDYESWLSPIIGINAA